MKYDPLIHKRRSIRLHGYDYSQAGLYFITICVQNREMLFGMIENDEMILNDAGKMIQTEWEKLPERFVNIKLHEFVVMPNHFHGIIEIVGATLVVACDVADKTDVAVGPDVVDKRDGKEDIQNDADMQGATTGVAPTGETAPNKTVGEMVGAFKSITTDLYITGVQELDWPRFDSKLWQRNYYENIIKNEAAYEKIADYIINNVTRWKDDKFYEK